MVVDFCEELHIQRSKDQFGKPSWFAQYDWCHTKTDLADGTVTIISFGEKDSIGKVCDLIDAFSHTEWDMKINIKVLLDNQELYMYDEY